MVFSDTFEIKYKLKVNTQLKKESAVRHFLEKIFWFLKNKKELLQYINF